MYLFLGFAEKGSADVTEADGNSNRSPAASTNRKVKVSTRTVVLSDGTYGTEDVYEDDDAAADRDRLTAGSGGQQLFHR